MTHVKPLYGKKIYPGNIWPYYTDITEFISTSLWYVMREGAGPIMCINLGKVSVLCIQ